MSWKFNQTEAVFIQIARRLKSEIVSGQYPPGAQIPPVRILAAEAAVNPNTVQKALTYLEDEGLIFASGTVGRFVTEDKKIIALAANKMRRETVRNLLGEARALGITRDELIQYLTEEENDV